ncbi:MAG: ATP-binding cassette domain-containing protein [Synechococcales cyanobacterium T60_A2020_003]|nr:ATP-binding cassette domain-containing protein [Synechococcales cyanobacterium T60_A2020_003]
MGNALNNSPILELQDLSFTYAVNKTPTLQSVNLTLYPGEVVWIAGTTGSGKSTLLNCIAGISPSHTGGRLAGKIQIGGQDVGNWSLRERSRQCCTLLQNVETQIFTDQVWDELIFGLENWAVEPSHIAPMAAQSLQEFGLADQADWAIARLSAGQKQRLLLASMLAIGQPILLFDEPLAYLDAQGVELWLHLLTERRQKGDAILVIEHRAELMTRLCNRAYRLQDGQLSEWNPQDIERATAISLDITPRSPQEPRPAPEICVLRTQNVAWGGYPAYPDLTLYAGEAVLLKGDNGCGKTTLLRLISGLLQPDQGEIELMGQTTRRKRGTAIAKIVGFVLQNPNHQLFAESVHAEVAQPGTDPKIATELLTNLDLMKLSDRHPHSLSQGQKRRLALAAVLVRQPQLCLLDEIMVGQDGRSLLLMLHALNAFTQVGGTLLFTSHDPRVVDPLNARVVNLP